MTIYSAQPDFDIEIHIVLTRPCVGITVHYWCQMKEDELNFVTMKVIFYKLFNFSRKITALSGFLFIGTHCEIVQFLEKKKKRTTGFDEDPIS